MNERINNLRLDAGISTLHDAPYLVAINKSGEIIDPIIGLEKFAELIVRQMLDITDAHTEVFRTDRDKAMIEHIKQSVKQHFGVEE